MHPSRLVCVWLFMLTMVGIVLLQTQVTAQSPNRQDALTEAEKRESIIFNAIADIATERDKVVRKCAVILWGEAVIVEDKHPIVQIPQLAVRVLDRQRKFDLAANFQVHPDHSLAGEERVSLGSVHKARNSGSLCVRPYAVKPVDDSVQDWNARYGAESYDPFDDEVSGPNSFQTLDGYGRMEQSLLNHDKLISTQQVLGGIIQGKWEGKGDITTHTVIDFDPAYRMMPSFISYQSPELPGSYGDTRVKWSAHGIYYTPSAIVRTMESMNHRTRLTTITYKCLWAIGDEVPDAIFTSEDHLAAVLDHFSIPHSRMVNGAVVHEFHQLPEDLYKPFEDEKVNQKHE